jgi:hypothetical protein
MAATFMLVDSELLNKSALKKENIWFKRKPWLVRQMIKKLD